ncbi:MAG: flagellin [Clostridiales bacterium]|nr:flagellin [Clostridiales bacterium]
MRINHNLMAMNTHRQLGINNTRGSKAMEKLSSGLRVNRAADDAAGLSISEKMRGQIRGLTQAARNTQDGISFIQTAEGALNEVSAMLVRMKELAVQYANGTLSETDQANIEAELDQLAEEIGTITSESTFNGISLFSTIEIVISDDDTKTFEIGIENIEIDLDENTTEEIEAAIDEVNTARANLGAQQNRLEHIYNNINTTTENLQAAEARIRDTDMAQEMMEFTKNNILQQAAQAMLAQANQVPQGVLQLLR